ncbi:MAG TPA: LiaF domain-containing protein [Miltoncostaea sp.]|nr:LiaF domain-containing protein [Miltoncostaea sp.]
MVNVMGGADLDLRQATVEAGETRITVFSLMGGSTIVVPEGVAVDAGGFAFMGGNDVRLEGRPPPPGAPRLRVRAWSLMGGTDVTTVPGPGRHHGGHDPRLPRPPAPPRPP